LARAPGFPDRGPFKGRDELQRFFDGLLGGWKPGTAVVARGFEEAGDKVLVWFEWRAVGEASEVPTSSERMAVYTIRGAQIVPWNSSMTATPRSALRNQASPTGTISRSQIKQ
jgi:hypothetical protein